MSKVPCNKCYYCLQRKRSQWLSRLSVEAKHSKSTHFVTLTYQDTALPVDDSGRPGVNKRDVQLFLKRLRKNTGSKFRYFCISEYGPHGTRRPHYHLIMFNLSVVEHVNTDTGQIIEKIMDLEDTTINILRSWKNGNVTVSPLTDQRIAYCTKYHSLPKDFGLPTKKHAPLFTLMSRRPGIGYQYLTTGKQYHEHNVDRWFFPSGGGNKRSMPRYYYEHFYNDEDKREHAEKIRLENEAKTADFTTRDFFEKRKKELSEYEQFKFITKKRFKDKHKI